MPNTGLSSKELRRRMIERRAIEAVIWGMPVVNYDLMFQAFRKLKGDFNQILYWSNLPNWKNQTLTPNPDSIYVMPFINTKDVGPVVLEIPPADDGSINGSVMDCWQAAFEDVGPAGVDKGKGAKYLILPPNHAATVPDGYVPMPSGNFQGYALLRSILKSRSPGDVAKAVAYAKRIKLYPLAQAPRTPQSTFIDAIDAVVDSTIPYDLRFFESLDRMVQAEPWLTRDKAMIDTLQSIGIERGKPFEPDAATQRVLKQAAAKAHAWLDDRYSAGFPPFDASARWALPVSPQLVDELGSNFADPDHYAVDGRGLTFTFAFFSAKHLGSGQYYLMTSRDKRGKALDGSATYRLRVPPNAPVSLYWSATAYDRATHALIRNRPWPSRSSQTPDLETNADGSVDLYFGPKSPTGKKANWVPTRAGGKFEVLFRLYGPQKPFFDKKWILPDMEKSTRT